MRTIPVGVALLFWWLNAFAQAPYPSKPITMIVPFPPGGVADIVGRPLAAQMEKALKQPVVVTNRTGAGGAVGMAAAAKSAPDGYTILMALSSISIFPVSDRIMGRAPAYEMKDFAPVALITADPTVLVVGADSPWTQSQGIRRFGQGLSGEDQLFVLGRVRHAARVDGDVRQRRGREAVPRALPGRRAGARRAARRPGARARLGPGARGRPDQSGQECARWRAGAASACR